MDHQHLPGDPARLIRGEEEDHVGEVESAAEPQQEGRRVTLQLPGGTVVEAGSALQVSLDF